LGGEKSSSCQVKNKKQLVSFRLTRKQRKAYSRARRGLGARQKGNGQQVDRQKKKPSLAKTLALARKKKELHSQRVS